MPPPSAPGALPAGPATVHHEVLSGHVPRARGSQEHCRPYVVVAVTRAPHLHLGPHESLAVPEALLPLLVEAAALVGGDDGARAQGVDGHAVRREAGRQVVGDAVYAMLAGEVRGWSPGLGVQLPLGSHPAVDRGDVDDASPAALRHARAE